jgi:hypothetical protein
MLKRITTKLTFLLLVLASCVANAQRFEISETGVNIKVEAKVEEHQWLDGHSYQFIAISVTGLPEINTNYSQDHFDSLGQISLKSLVDMDAYAGGYSAPVLVSQNQSFQPIKTIKEAVYDTLSKSSQVKVTSLFLLDDFDKVKTRETILVICRGVFGHPRQSMAYFEKFVSACSFENIVLKTNDNVLVANRAWYKKWLKNAPKNYWDPRKSTNNDISPQNFKFYLERFKGNN